MTDPAADATLHRALGLTDDEAASIAGILGRPPNHLELAMYAVMWSEHCSYKSSRLHLRRLPTEAPQVLVGPGENAGVVDVGDGIAVALRIESHNHPSAVEPYQGAATGVGGILRDIFTMGARPIALMDPLFFGPPDDARGRWLVEGVVSGISGYGNAVGVPTVGGELTFSPCYARNPLVNVLCLGVLRREHLVLSGAHGEGNLAVLLGSTTGRDGIGGVSVLASAGFGDRAGEDGDKRPSVQVGDPFEEKRLIEACLELLGRGLVVGIQDLGGAGLACATSETAGRAGMGMDVDVGAVPRREPGMEPFEVLTSESQERMLAIVTPGDRAEVEEVCRRWEVRATVIGTVTAPLPAADDGTGGGRLRILDTPGGEVLADVPAASLSDDAPLYDRPMAPPADLGRRRADNPAALAPPTDCGADVLSMLADTSWVWRQYDHQLFLNTVTGPGGDAAVLRLSAPGLPPSRRGLALSTDSNPRWCALDPRAGTALTVAESALNVACAGARPVALVNCLNFGNPEHPEVMWQLSEAIDGMAAACRELAIPVVGGNVSLYNESGGTDIDPTPVVAVLGVIDDLARRPPGALFVAGTSLVLVGATDPSLAGSRWAVDVRSHRGGVLPTLDLSAHGALLRLVADLVTGGDLVVGIHDVSDGGLGLALAECAVRGGVGCVVEHVDSHAQLFSESPGRVVVGTTDPHEVLARAAASGIPARMLGRAGGERLVVDGLVDVSVADATSAWRDALPGALGQPPAA
ncbi:MAG TPA: phosphoribosylformylglycinamidine synthase subunit PurL [Acidimicrobiales bacterium]|nr:phosphoribosylformylglycinamidine synthase subunit PurL [Acidimicrobiales bacterium]